MEESEEVHCILTSLKKYEKKYKRATKETKMETKFDLLKQEYRKKYYRHKISKLSTRLDYLTNPSLAPFKTETLYENKIKSSKKQHETSFKKYFEKKHQAFTVLEQYGEFVDLTSIYNKYKNILKINIGKNYRDFVEKVFFLLFEINDESIEIIKDVVRYLTAYYKRLNPNFRLNSSNKEIFNKVESNKAAYNNNQIVKKKITAGKVFIEENTNNRILTKYKKLLVIFTAQFTNTLSKRYYYKKTHINNKHNVSCQFCKIVFSNWKDLRAHLNTKAHNKYFNASEKTLKNKNKLFNTQINNKIGGTNKTQISRFIFKSSYHKVKEYFKRFFYI
ncbi:hypothetical protein CDIK_0821 [Cucumispora dikerogammari]|nr:hypothetical protein CDIK_0821 [Cucumispora dikerogammari]